MKTQSIDTCPKAEEIQISLLQQESAAKKFQRVCSLSDTVIRLSKRAIARANKNLNEQQINLLFIEYHYGKKMVSLVEEYLKKK